MKKTVIIAAIVSLTLAACKNEVNKTEMQKDASEIMQVDNDPLFDEANSYGYIASDGSRATVDYQNDGNTHTITIKANNMKYVLDKKDGDAQSQIYERNGVEAKLTKDSLFITQNDIVIPMALAK